jgi:hypothetical protein
MSLENIDDTIDPWPYLMRCALGYSDITSLEKATPCQRKHLGEGTGEFNAMR